jgi:hypothetical protein
VCNNRAQGATPSLADLEVYGVLQAVRGALQATGARVTRTPLGIFQP